MSCSAYFVHFLWLKPISHSSSSLHMDHFVRGKKLRWRGQCCADYNVPLNERFALRRRNRRLRVVQAHQRENSTACGLCSLWYELITSSTLVFDTVGSHASSFVCLLGLYKPFLVKCSHTRVPHPLGLGTKQTKGLFAPACARSCDEA